MATDVKKHTTFAAGEVPKRQVAGGSGLADAILSINDVVPCATVTEQTQVAAGLSSTSYPVGASRPLATVRADARALHQLEISRDGNVFVPQSGVLSFASDSARDTWTSANSSLLAIGDRCISNGIEYRWNGTTPWQPVGRIAFTPTWSNFTVGASTVTGTYEVVGGFVIGFLKLVLGAGYSIPGGGDMQFVPPIAMASLAAFDGAPLGELTMLRSGTGWYAGRAVTTAAGNIAFKYFNNGNPTFYGGITATAPATWASGDVFSAHFTYPI